MKTKSWNVEMLMALLCTWFIHINIIQIPQKIHLIWTEHYSKHNAYVVILVKIWTLLAWVHHVIVTIPPSHTCWYNGGLQLLIHPEIRWLIFIGWFSDLRSNIVWVTTHTFHRLYNPSFFLHKQIAKSWKMS